MARPLVEHGTLHDSWGASRPNRNGGSRPHAGTDIGARRGTPVVSPIAGRVERVSLDPANRNFGGNRVWIKGDDTRHYYFAHLDRIDVKNGDAVAPGATQLGTVGNTGSSAKNGPPHLHFGINIHGMNGTGTDPMGQGWINPFGELARDAQGNVVFRGSITPATTNSQTGLSLIQ